MKNQRHLFDAKRHQLQPQQRPRSAPALRGLIQRGLEQLKNADNWIERTSGLKFKRLEVNHGDL